MKNYIDVNKTEEEKVEDIKNWIKNNFLVIILGIGIGFGSVFGWQYYNDIQQEERVNARAQYLSIVNGSDATIDNHTEYQNQVLLLQAKNTREDSNTALEHLNAIESDSVIQYVKDINLAKIYFDKGEYQTALDLLESNPLSATSLHLAGDIYAATDRVKIAQEVYAEALEKTDNTNVKNIIQVKINTLR